MQLNELTHRDEFPLFCIKNRLSEGAEIGVAYGEYAETLLNAWLGKLYLIDPWEEQPRTQWKDGGIIGNFHDCWVYCNGKLSRFKSRIEYIRKYSDDALKNFADESLDFVYIDGNHESPQVDRDVFNWYHKVKKGGVLGGHDYDNASQSRYTDVKQAVDRLCKEYDLKLHLTMCSSWWIQK